MSDEAKLDSRPKIKVMFSADEGAKLQQKEECIVLWPTDKKWNDFGLKSRFDFTYFPEKGDSFSGMLKLAFLTDTPETNDPHELLLSKIKGRKLVSCTDLPLFFTLLLELDEYRKIVSALNADLALKVMQSLNDIGLAANGTRPEKWVSSALESKAFNNSLARTPQSYFAFLNGHHILYDRDLSANLSPPDDFSVKFKLDSFPNEHVVNFAYQVDGKVTSRICAMIGEK